MSTAIVPARTTNGSAVTGAVGGSVATATYSLTPALDNTYGHIAIIRRRSPGVAYDTALATPSGWTLVKSQSATNGTVTTYIGVFAKRGDGSTNSLSVTTPEQVTTQIILTAWALEQPSDTFVSGAVSVGANNVATQNLTLATSALRSSVGVMATVLSGTAGGTGFSFSEGTLIKTTGSADSVNGVYTGVTEPPAGKTITNTWPSATIAASVAFWIAGSSAAITHVNTKTDATYISDNRSSSVNSGGTLSFSISPSAGVTEAVEGLFIIPKAASDVAYTVTATDSKGAPSATSVFTVPARDRSIRTRTYTGSAWV